MPIGSHQLPSLSVIVAAFNEEDSIEEVIGEIRASLSRLGWPCEIIIVDDGSSDRTGVIADLLSDGIPEVRVIHHEENLGLGGVYRTGFEHAQKEYVTLFPADGQFPATIVEQFAPLMESADMVLGYLPDRDSSVLAKGLSGAERVLYRLLFGTFPRFQGILMFRRSLLDELHLKSTGRSWTILMELVIRASRGGYRLMSVPTEMRPRMSGASKVNNLATIWANLKGALSLRRSLWTDNTPAPQRRQDLSGG
jgi:glycosyltransferase involved in cell wall biosynthesis